MSKKQTLENKDKALHIAVVRRSACCNSNTYESPSYYTNTMKTHTGEDIPKRTVCIKCGHECSTLF